MLCLRLLKESNQSRFDSYSRYIRHIPYYLSGLSRSLFLTTFFLEITLHPYKRRQICDTVALHEFTRLISLFHLGQLSLPFPNSLQSQGPLSSFLFYVVRRHDVFLCNEERKNSIEDCFNFTC